MPIPVFSPIALLTILAFQDSPPKPPAVDFSKIDRKIAKEPKYVANPLYGLIVFDTECKSKAWVVLDKSSPKEPDHDILYLDRNGNGDLTEPGERLAGTRNGGKMVVHKAGSIKLSDSGVEHTDFRLFVPIVQVGVTPLFSIKLGGKEEMWGGISRPGEQAGFGSSPEKAPVFVASLQISLTFQLFRSNSEFSPGGNERIAVVVGIPGSGPGTFTAVHEDYLVPGKDLLFGTWIGKDSEGREIRERFQIRKHC